MPGCEKQEGVALRMSHLLLLVGMCQSAQRPAVVLIDSLTMQSKDEVCT